MDVETPARGGKKEINELHLPLNKAVTLTMTSQDVIHSFYVPAFRVKQDVVPGKYTTEWFGRTSSASIIFFARVLRDGSLQDDWPRGMCMEPADYERWLTTGETGQSNRARGTQALSGKRYAADVTKQTRSCMRHR
jgi:cytochrome c oxidase subunit 2